MLPDLSGFTSLDFATIIVYTARLPALRLSPARRARSLYLCPPVTGWPSFIYYIERRARTEALVQPVGIKGKSAYIFSYDRLVLLPSRRRQYVSPKRW
jgi:hypothetical protein